MKTFQEAESWFFLQNNSFSCIFRYFPLVRGTWSFVCRLVVKGGVATAELANRLLGYFFILKNIFDFMLFNCQRSQNLHFQPLRDKFPWMFCSHCADLKTVTKKKFVPKNLDKPRTKTKSQRRTISQLSGFLSSFYQETDSQISHRLRPLADSISSYHDQVRLKFVHKDTPTRVGGSGLPDAPADVQHVPPPAQYWDWVDWPLYALMSSSDAIGRFSRGKAPPPGGSHAWFHTGFVRLLLSCTFGHV